MVFVDFSEMEDYEGLGKFFLRTIMNKKEFFLDWYLNNEKNQYQGSVFGSKNEFFFLF